MARLDKILFNSSYLTTREVNPTFGGLLVPTMIFLVNHNWAVKTSNIPSVGFFMSKSNFYYVRYKIEWLI